MACCLTAPIHYLNQCWHVEILWHSPEGNTNLRLQQNLTGTNEFRLKYFRKINVWIPRDHLCMQQPMRDDITMLCPLIDWAHTQNDPWRFQLPSFEIEGNGIIWWLLHVKHLLTQWRPSLSYLIWYMGPAFERVRPRRKRHHFADNISKCIFLNENVLIFIEISLKFIPKSPINHIPALVQIMAWRQPVDKPYMH